MSYEANVIFRSVINHKYLEHKLLKRQSIIKNRNKDLK